MVRSLNLNESFISKIWEKNSLYCSDLKTIGGEPVSVLQFGIKNFDSGPDYLNAKIKIGEKIFCGDIEVHKDFSGWSLHKHKGDHNYNSVVLQVIMWNTGIGYEPKVKRNRDINTLVLSDFLIKPLNEIWQDIISNPVLKFKLPCIDYENITDEMSLKKFLSKLSLDRLNLKSKRIKDRIYELAYDDSGNSSNESLIHKPVYWQQAFYEFIFEALGFSKNKEQMLTVAKNLKLKDILKKTKNYSGSNIMLIQALLFGKARLLNELKYRLGYPYELKALWTKCVDNFNFQQINKINWKFFRLRPGNFPTIRLAYGAQIISGILFDDIFKKTVVLFDQEDIKITNTYSELVGMYEPADDSYWNYNYTFGRKTEKKLNLIGKERINDIITNVIIPFIYLYSRLYNKERIKSNVLRFYSTHRTGSTNSILKIIGKQLLNPMGIKTNTPAIQQAAIQLFNFYCLREKCDECKIGINCVKNGGYEYKIIFY